jgi:hypothetical protein
MYNIKEDTDVGGTDSISITEYISFSKDSVVFSRDGWLPPSAKYMYI